MLCRGVDIRVMQASTMSRRCCVIALVLFNYRARLSALRWGWQRFQISLLARFAMEQQGGPPLWRPAPRNNL